MCSSDLDASGAQGGGTNGRPGGKGARLQAYVLLQAGDKLAVVVGQQGGAGVNKSYLGLDYYSGGGGGGGTFFVKVGGSLAPVLTPLLIAGGGGGAGKNSDGAPGHLSPKGDFYGSGGDNGDGGQIASVGFGGAGGAGLYGDGDTLAIGSDLSKELAEGGLRVQETVKSLAGFSASGLSVCADTTCSQPL